MGTRVRVAFVSNYDPASRCAIRAVSQRHDVFVFRPGPSRRRRRGLPRDPLGAIARVARQRWYAQHFARMDAQIGRALGFDDELDDIEVVDVERAALRAPDAGQLLRARDIDALVVSGGPVLKPHFYEAADLAVNLHMGIVPHYRGEHTLFWPLRRGDWEHVGATLHMLDEGIDTGAVLSRVYPALDADVTEATVWARAAQMLADELIDWLDAVEQGAELPPSEPVAGRGTFVRYADRRLRHDALWELRRRIPSIGPPPRAPAIERRWIIPPDAD